MAALFDPKNQEDCPFLTGDPQGCRTAFDLFIQNRKLLLQEPFLRPVFENVLRGALPQQPLTCLQEGGFALMQAPLSKKLGPLIESRLKLWMTELNISQPKPATDDLVRESLGFVVGRAAEEKIPIESFYTDPRPFYLLVFGAGMGVSLDLITKKVSSYFLYVAECSRESLFFSLFTVDWASLVRWYPSPRLQVFLDEDPQRLADTLLYEMSYHNPFGQYNAMDIVGWPSRPLRRAQDLFRRAGLFRGNRLSDFDNERHMLRHSYANLIEAKEKNYWLGPPEALSDRAVAVVGSGPSLDQDLKDLKRLRRDLFVISCGTALHVLLEAGIVPDVEVVLERDTVWGDRMLKVAKDHDLSEVVLVASSSADPRLNGIFKKTIFFIRRRLTPQWAFDLEARYDLPAHYPTVTNTGVSLGLHWGFGKIFLVGIDGGARIKERHHAREAYAWMENGARRTVEQALNYEAEGNFGGTVWSSRIFMETTAMIERILGAKLAEQDVYNCSDGVLIRGAKPQLFSEIKTLKKQASKNWFTAWQDRCSALPRETLKKNMAWLNLHQGFGMVRQEIEKLYSPLRAQKANFADFLDRISTVLMVPFMPFLAEEKKRPFSAAEQEDRWKEIPDCFHVYPDHIRRGGHEGLTALCLVRGSLSVYLSLAYDLWRRVRKDQQPLLEPLLLEGLGRLLQNMERQAARHKRAEMI